LSLSVGTDCRYRIFNPPTSDYCEGASFKKDTLAPSETTSVSHICCDFKEAGDFFYVEVNITYTQRVGENKITKRDSGVIQGYVE
jgi:hypothetical protein